MAQIAAFKRIGLRLPAFLDVRKMPLKGRGIYTHEKVKEDAVIFKEERPFAFGIAGPSPSDVKSICSNCLKPVSNQAIECKGCNAIGYCSEGCLNEAKPLHSIECAGLRALEDLRESVGVNLSVEYPPDQLWPPIEVLIAARALNQEALEYHAPKMSEVAKGPSSFNGKLEAFLVRCLTPLLHPKVNKDFAFLAQVFSSVAVTNLGLSNNEGDFMGDIAGLYANYMLLNHSCQTNCIYSTLCANLFVYADEDIKTGEQLCISYVHDWKLALPGEYRRHILKSNWGFEFACDICTRERKRGTQYHQRDQKKRSLIIPWTKRQAEDTMKEGVEGLEEIEKCGRDWSSVRKNAEKVFEQQRKVLDETNSIRTLTAYFMMKAYYNQGDAVKALEVAESIRTPIQEYCSPQVISEYSVVVSHCYFDTGCSTRGIKECIRAIELYPRNLNDAKGPGRMIKAIEKAISAGDPNVTMKIMTLCKNTPVNTKEFPGMVTPAQACKMQ